MEDLFSILKKGEEEIVLNENKEAVLLVGITGTGKTALTLFITQDIANLESVSIGAGQFLIKDTNGKIGNETAISQTLFPDLMIDVDRNGTYYDCPGFSDSRSANHDIAATFFVKTVVDHLEWVKILLVVNYSSLEQGNERSQFKDAVKHLISLITDIDKFKDGIALIATKVSNTFIIDDDGTMRIISDEELIDGIAQFLLEFKNSLPKLFPDKGLYKKALSLIEILLTNQGNDYIKLGIFRKPTKKGPLNEMVLLKKNKIRLQQVVEENMKFIPKIDGDFGYTLSDATKLIVSDVVMVINKNIKTTYQKIQQEINEYYRNKIQISDDIYKLRDILNSAHQSWSTTLKNASTFIECKQFIDEVIINTAAKINLHIPNDLLQSILTQAKYFKFLQQVSISKLQTTPLDWIRALEPISTYVNQSLNWYKFLIFLYDTLSQYDIQKDATRYNVDDIENWGKPDTTQGIKITYKNFRLFIQKLGNLNVRGYDNIKDVQKIDESELRDLNIVLDTTLVKQPESKCSKSDKLTIKGNFVKLSDVVKISCYNITKLEIFARNAVFINEDIVKIGQMMLVVVAAPTWHIDGDRKVILIGTIGSSKNKAQSSVHPMERGLDGQAGTSGGNGGTFFGIAKQFINGNRLTIDTSGGNGGSGQEGGNGGDGGKTSKPYPPWSKKIEDIEFEHSFIKDSKPTAICYVTSCTMFFGEHHYIYGKPSNGGNGGDGGKGGFGGNEGELKLITIEKPSNVVLKMNKGNHGQAGIGGKGGKAGESTITIEVKFTWFLGIDLNDHYYADIVSTRIGAPSISGTNGSNDKITIGRVTPGPSETIKKPLNIVSDFKYYLRENLNNPIQRRFLEAFLNKLNDNVDIKQMESTSSFVYELLGLENQFFSLNNNKVAMLPLYEHMLQKIDRYAKTPKSHENNINYKKVLNYIYTATLSKICSLQYLNDGNLITDLNGYLETATININKLKQIGKHNTINKIKNNYKELMEQKISEALELIKNRVEPEIENINAQIDENITKLINEVIEQQKQAEVENEKLMKRQQALAEAIKLKMAFGVIGIVGQAIGFLGPLGKVVGTMIEATSSVAQSFMVTTDSNQTAKSLPEGAIRLLGAAGDSYETEKKKKTENLKDQINKLSKQVNEHKDYLESLKSTLQSIDTQVSCATYENIDILEDAYLTALTNKEEELKEKEQKQGKNVRQGLKVINSFLNIASLAKASGDLYMQYKNDSNALQTASNAVKLQQKQIDALIKYQKEISNTIRPMIQNMQNNIKEIESDLANKSHASLDITKWNIQTKIRDMKATLQQFMKNYKIQESLFRAIEKLEEAMELLINVYDRIQNFQEQQQLATYIADISSPQANDITVSDPDLNQFLNELNLVIESGIVYGQYQRAVNAFLQWVFPFSDSYFDVVQLPPYLRLTNSINDLVLNAASRLEIIKAKLNEYKQVIINGGDEYIKTSDFYSNYSITNPFYSWKNADYKHELSQLLSGEEVILQANILNGDNKNAIKFNLLEIYFKSTNETVQNELNFVLNNFEVSMRHMGTSYYRCGKRFFLIVSESQLLEYTFQKNPQGIPVTYNNVYEKIKNGDLMLSPYTLWNIKLEDSKRIGYEHLARFKDIVDLELVGHGQFVSNRSKVCEEKLEIYHELDETLSTIRHVDIQRDDLQEENIKRFSRHVNKNSNDNEIYQFASSAASSSTLSSINDLFKWTKNKIGSFFKPIPTSNKFDVPYLPTIAENSQHTNNNFQVNWSDFQYVFNPTILLLDFIVRKFTKEKTVVFDDASILLLAAQADALELINELERGLQTLFGTNTESFLFDPLLLQQTIIHELINGHYSNIPDVICKTLHLNKRSDYLIDKITSKMREIFTPQHRYGTNR